MRMIQCLSVLALSTLTLVGCHKPVSTQSDAAMAQASFAQGRGLADSSGYQAMHAHYDRDGKLINPLQAPANQTYYFAFDSNQVLANDYRALRIQAGYLAAHPNAKVRLEGNTDNIGSREYNIALGWRRDQAIAHALAQFGARPSQLDMVSYGKEQPAAAGDDERARRLNRRVSMVYEGY